MALVRNMTTREEIPHEPGEWMELRRLSYAQLREAAEARSRQVMATARDLGPAFMRELRSLPSETQEAVQTAAADPLNDYDLGLLLRHGIVAWSYPEPVPLDPAAELDPETAEWAGRAILRLCGIGREAEDDRKNA